MRTAIAVVMALAVASLYGCRTSPEGGVRMNDEGFRIVVTRFTPNVTQGEIQTVTVMLKRDSLFKQDVKLEVKAASGITVEPTRITVKASDKPDVQLQITAPKHAALGEYPIVVTGTPETGESTSLGFTVNVVSP